METFLLTAYVLMWPVIVAGVLWTLCRAFLRDWLDAKKEGRGII